MSRAGESPRWMVNHQFRLGSLGFGRSCLVRPGPAMGALPQPQPQQRCGQWLPSKRRQCASWALPGDRFCGNHRPSSAAEGSADRRVACPLDPSQ